MQRHILEQLSREDWASLIDLVGFDITREYYGDHASEIESTRRAVHKLAAEGLVETTMIEPERSPTAGHGRWTTRQVQLHARLAAETSKCWAQTRRAATNAKTTAAKTTTDAKTAAASAATSDGRRTSDDPSPESSPVSVGAAAPGRWVVRIDPTEDGAGYTRWRDGATFGSRDEARAAVRAELRRMPHNYKAVQL